MSEKRWWTVKELAKAARVSGARVRHELALKRLHGEKAGQTWVIPDVDAQRWLDERRRR